MVGLLFRIMIWIVEIVVGIGLVINCARGLFSGEGMYDRQNRDYMIGSQIFGIGLGLFLLVHALGLVRIPIPFLGRPF